MDGKYSELPEWLKDAWKLCPKIAREAEKLYKPDDWDRWITPEQYKERTKDKDHPEGKDWPDDAIVWSRVDDHIFNPEWYFDTWKNTQHVLKTDTYCITHCVIANEHGKPPADFIPEETK
jgi:hypothetical protein